MSRSSKKDQGQVGANDHSRLCSTHFEDHCFESYSNQSHLGLGKAKSLLKPDAVPSIFEKPVSLNRLSMALN